MLFTFYYAFLRIKFFTDLRFQYTFVISPQNNLNFQDITVSFNDYFSSTNWYRKPKWSGKFENYLTYLLQKYKISVINNLVDKGLLSDHEFHQDNINLTKEMFI